MKKTPPMLQTRELFGLCYCGVINIFLIHTGFLLLFLHAWSRTSQLLFNYVAAVSGFPVTQLNTLVWNQQMPPVCSNQDAVHSQGSFFSHLLISSPFFSLPEYIIRDACALFRSFLVWINCKYKPASKFIVDVFSKLWKEDCKHYI